MAQILSGKIEDLLADFIEVRKNTLTLFRPLKIEDAVVQSNVFGSPPNWHLAHVTWFFQKMLQKHGEEIRSDENVNLEYLNSYYQQFGKILPKSERGKFPRPTVDETLKYRSFTEEKVISFLKRLRDSSGGISDQLKYDILLANQHEMQHQELMIYDFQHYFQRFRDAEDNYKPMNVKSRPSKQQKSLSRSILENKKAETKVGVSEASDMVTIDEGIFELGFHERGFCYDNELPENKTYLQQYKIDVFPVTNMDYIKFINDDGYHNYKYWLADGWDKVQENGWEAPLYWEHNESHGINTDNRWI